MAKRKAKTVYFTPEPDWSKFVGITDPELQAKAYQDVQYFVRTEIADKTKLAITRKWIKENSGWDKKEIAVILKNPDWTFSASSSTFFTAQKLGYIPETVLAHLEKRRAEWIERGNSVIEEAVAKAEKKPIKVVSIQERMKEQVCDLCGDLEYFLDQMVDGEKTLKEFDPYKLMQIYQPEIKGPHAKIIKDEFQSGYEESLEVLEWKDEEIKEAYSNFDVKMRKAYVEYFEMIMTACDTIIKTKATTRKARKPKAKSKDKIVAKLKFKINDPELGLASVPPTDVVYCNEAWVYNTKTRKVGVYRAKDPDPKNLAREGAGLTVKGTTIQDFCEKTSVQKTLRKPKEQIKGFVVAKTACNKNFASIKTTDTKMNGRLNEHTIILKTF